MSIVVFCSGSISKGLGHIQRARVFTDTLYRAGYKVTLFVKADKTLVLPQQFTGYEMYRVDQEEELVSFIETEHPTLLVFDTLVFSEDLFQSIQNQIATVSISPIFNLNSKVQAVFSRVFIPEVHSERLYHGLQFAMFSEYCKQVDYYDYLEHLSQPTLNIGVSMGGTDAPNKTLKIVEALSKVETSSTFWILLGEGYTHSYDQLAKIAASEKKHEFILAKTSRSMWKILSTCSLNILSGGITLLESVYAGIPAIHLFEKEEHRQLVPDLMIERNVICDLGVFNEEGLNQIPIVAQELMATRSKLLKMHESTKGMLDNRAPIRIVEICKQNGWIS